MTGPGTPTTRDLEVLSALRSRDAVLTLVGLSDGRELRVWNIAWGYDAGDTWSHVTTNCSPSVAGETVDVFSTDEVTTVGADGRLLVGPAASEQ